MNIPPTNGLKIAVDFDGTIVENEYPEIGREMMFAFATMKELQKKGHKLVLWTYRTGQQLKEAIEFCRNNGVEFYAVNENYPGETSTENYSRKLLADVFIDDRNIGGFIGWSRVWQLLSPGDPEMAIINPEAHQNFKKRNTPLSIFKNILRR